MAFVRNLKSVALEHHQLLCSKRFSQVNTIFFGHSLTTLTKFFPLLTTYYLPLVDKGEDMTFLIAVIRKNLYLLHTVDISYITTQIKDLEGLQPTYLVLSTQLRNDPIVANSLKSLCIYFSDVNQRFENESQWDFFTVQQILEKVLSGNYELANKNIFYYCY